MPGSCSLEEAAERLGLTMAELRRHIDQGAFPGRYLSRGQSGIEMRLPTAEVEAFERLRGARPLRPLSLDPGQAMEPVAGSMRAHELSEEVAAYQRLFVDMMESERSALFDAVGRAFGRHDREVASLRDEVEALRDELHEAMTRLEQAIRRSGRSMSDWSELPKEARGVDVDKLLRELGELEEILGVDNRSN